MDTSAMFWNASIQELKKGYVEETDFFTCLLCGRRIEKGIIYPVEDKLYDAERYTQAHIKQEHVSVFDYIMKMDKKLTGLTEHQNKLLRLFYEGKNNKEIQAEMGIGSISTIRNHRFVLKEKERQAKMFLAVMELLNERDAHAPVVVPPHKQARMVDSRYNVTEEEQEKVIQKFMPEGVLLAFPPKEKQRLIIMREMAKKFKAGQVYSEKETNEILFAIFNDYVKIRRYLIEYGFLNRKPDGSEYWVNE
ncbi:DUF2087 domain-containing protein [Domibacillus indicus]|uniref:DUF2087 domain-containing protein n=1 Tax=Domibacillus indicus TaxID=1437523 RepID=UPI00203F6A96|nr:DUF2087 domain-containing protein [Domibacillus indicus]MCM3790911.1 DUF2087 domain-containing protein [Domibacillus indicus]